MKLRVLLTATLLGIGASALAAAATPAGVKVEGAWIRWLPANLPSAGYAKLVNSGDGVASLTRASSPDYRHVTLMQSRLAQQDSSMVSITHINVPAHGSTALAPGGYHIMLMGATRTLKPGEKVPITLHFGDGTSLQVDFSMLPADATGPPAS